MASTQAEPATSPAEDSGNSIPGRWDRKVQFVAQWWPVLSTGIAATALASFLYVASALAFAEWRLDYGFGFTFFGMFINTFPPAIVWAAMKWTR